MSEIKDEGIAIPEEVIMNKIYIIRDQKVMLSGDLAELYQVETKALNQQVKRNEGRFPKRYVFKLTMEEYKSLRSQFVTLKRGRHTKYPPYAFTEHGVLMLSNVLKSKRAETVSLLIVDTFVKLREVLTDNLSVRFEIEEIKKKLENQDKNIELVFSYLDELIEKQENPLPRKQIGYKRKNEV